MVIEESILIVLLIMLLAGIILPILLKKFHLPLATLLIFAGAILGPNLLGYIQPNEVILFFGFLGMTFLMLMAGIETDISKLFESKFKIFVLSLVNGLLPFLTGLFIMTFFGYSWIESILVGIIFISSSVAIILPVLGPLKNFDKDFKQLVLSSVLVTDIISLILLGILFQNISPITNLPFWVYLPLLFLSLIALFIIVPKIYIINKRKFKEEGSEEKVRLIMVIIIGSIIYFSGLGVHPILSSFLVGFMLSGVLLNSHKIKEKLNVLGYGIFIPVFFFIVGMELDLKLLSFMNFENLIILALLFGLMFSKFLSGFIGGKIVGLSFKESSVFGSISMTQLTTTLAVAYSASALGIIPKLVLTSIILISTVTTFVGPVIATLISRHQK